MVVRALGPTLSTYGVHGAVANPRIGIYHGNRQIGENSDWKSGAAADTLRQLQIAPADDREAALYLTLLPGAYTVRVSNEVTGEGVVLVEVYDIKPATFSTQ